MDTYMLEKSKRNAAVGGGEEEDTCCAFPFSEEE